MEEATFVTVLQKSCPYYTGTKGKKQIFYQRKGKHLPPGREYTGLGPEMLMMGGIG